MQGLITALGSVKTTIGAVLASVCLVVFVILDVVQGEFRPEQIGLGASFLVSMWIGVFSKDGDASDTPTE